MSLRDQINHSGKSSKGVWGINSMGVRDQVSKSGGSS